MARYRVTGEGGTVVDKTTKEGTFPWPVGGVAVYTGGPFGIVSDNHRGAIIAGVYFTSPSPQNDAEGRIQHIDSTGQLLWGVSGKIFTPDADVETFPTLVSDGASGALVAWDDTTNGKRARYVARFNQDGEMRWKTKGFRLWLRTVNGPPIFSNDMGSIMWLVNDFSTRQGDLYAFRVDSSGYISWGSNGVLIRYRDFEEWPYFLEVTSDGRGGFIAVWSERRGPGWQNLVLQQISVNGKLGDVITRVENVVNVWQRPQNFLLFHTFPNPSNPATKINFSLRHPSKIQINVINIRGDLVTTLADGQFVSGKHELYWSGRNYNGKEVSSGVYFIQMLVDGRAQVRKHLLIH